MNYYAFHCSCIGASHIRTGLPLQDHSFSRQDGRQLIAVTADGHGSRRHFRSDTGAELACKTAAEKIRLFLNDPADHRPMDDRLEDLKLDICNAWQDAVLTHYHENPWTAEELEEEKELLSPEQFERLTGGTDILIPYGSTLCAVFSDDDFWAAIQLGDGAVVCISRNGEYTWPMPESIFNIGNKTASLCMDQPMRDFRHCFGSGYPAGILVFTDGIDKSFPEQGREIVSFLHWVWNNARQHGNAGTAALEKTLETLTNRSVSGDDVSIAGYADRDVEDIRPKATQQMLKRQRDRQDARIKELKSSLEYNRKQLKNLEKNGGNPDSVKQITGIIVRLESELERMGAGDAGTEPDPNEINTELTASADRGTDPDKDDPEKKTGKINVVPDEVDQIGHSSRMDPPRKDTKIVPVKAQESGSKPAENHSDRRIDRQQVYEQAVHLMTSGGTAEYQNALNLLEQIRGYKDTSELIEQCRSRTGEPTPATGRGISSENRKKTSQKILIAAAAAIAFFVLILGIGFQNGKINKLHAGQTQQAIYAAQTKEAEPTKTPTETKTISQTALPTQTPDADFDIRDGVLRKYRGNNSVVTIPASITSIGDHAFSGCVSLTSVTIPDGVVSIGTAAFSGCVSLTSVTIPDSVISIGERAFSECSSLTSVTIPDGVTSIGYHVFWGCVSLTSITIPDSVTSIGEWAFWDCRSLTSVTIPDSVTSIGESAFWGCANLISVTIPDSVTFIGDAAFSGCRSLTSVRLPAGVTFIGNRTFSGCGSLTFVAIPDGVTSIADSAFWDCGNLTSVTMPDSVISIGKSAFFGCGSLRSVTIPDSVSYIGDHAFNYDCVLNVKQNSYADRWCRENAHKCTNY